MLDLLSLEPFPYTTDIRIKHFLNQSKNFKMVRR